MPFCLTMPKLSPTMEEGTISTWFKKEGDLVKPGDLLIEVATDKAQVEFHAIDEGYLRKILIPSGAEAVVNQNIAVFSEKKQDKIDAFLKQIEPKKEKAAKLFEQTDKHENKKIPSSESASMSFMTFEAYGPIDEDVFSFPTEPQSRIKASPLAKKMADEKGLDIASVKGSGPGGRVIEKDLELAQKKALMGFSLPQAPKIKAGTYSEQSLSPMRKVIAQRLQAAKASIPHYYVSEKIDAGNLNDLKDQLKSSSIKLSVNDLILKACALALKQHPNINCGFNSKTNSIIEFKTIDISVAVSVESGLITPIIYHADCKNVGQIAQEVRHLAGLAKKGKLAPYQYQGGSFTVSNLGMYGISDFKAVINPPQAAILAVSALRDEPIVKDGKVVPGKTMSMCLSSDHRVIDGAQAAEFMRTLKNILQAPAILLLSA